MSAYSDERFRNLLGPYQFGLLDEAETQELEQHILDCPDCLDDVKQFVRAGLLIRHDADVRETVETLALEVVPVDEETVSDSESHVGRQRPRVRIIPVVVAVAAVLVLLILKPWDIEFRPTKEAVAGRKMIAVLPFENVGDPEDEYFADGITDEITGRLALLQGLGVISRTSAATYKSTNKTLREIGNELGVSYILEGTIRWDRSDSVGQIRILPQLIRVSDDSQIWSQTYERSLANIFAVQQDIAERVAKALNITLRKRELEAISSVPTQNLDAYNAYLRGIDLLLQPDFSDIHMRLVVEMFERAVQLDSLFALAYAGLSEAHSAMYHFRADVTMERLAKAKAAADRALALNPRIPESHLALGWYYYRANRDYDRAESCFEDAERLSPNDWRVLLGLSTIHKRRGELEMARTYLTKATEINPRDPNLFGELGLIGRFLRDSSEALNNLKRANSLAPDEDFTYFQLVRVYRELGDTSAARELLREVPRTQPGLIHYLSFRIDVLERDYDRALSDLDSIPWRVQSGQIQYDPISLLAAQIYDWKGERETALALYDSARVLLEGALIDQPDEPRILSALGLALAGLGQKDRAIREGKRAVALFPVSKDAINGTNYCEYLARILTATGEKEAAIDQIEYLLSIPSKLTVPLLRLDPTWDPLRDHPRFQALLQRHNPI